MSAIIVPGQPAPRTELPLTTRRRNQIANSQSLEAVPLLYCHIDDQQRKKFPKAIIRSGPSAVYNCHGLTFAGRRTTISESSEIRKIINEDDYVRVEQKDVLPGDVVLYVDKETGDIEHSAIVVSNDLADMQVPRTVSKWGHCSEAVHLLSHCPYNTEGVEFYRVNK